MALRNHRNAHGTLEQSTAAPQKSPAIEAAKLHFERGGFAHRTMFLAGGKRRAE